MKHLGCWIIGVLSVALLVASGFRWIDEINFVDACGFATGAMCVWLAVRENPWNWPVGLANNVFFMIIFTRARLFAETRLQVVYFALGVWGWWQWLRGGVNHSERIISRAHRNEWFFLAATVAVGTFGLQRLLVAVNGAAPLPDALVTMLSLAAQYLMSLKRLEHWFVWILVDVISVPLFLHRGLPLMATLYAGFLVLCVIGVRRWTRDWRLAAGARV